MGIVGLFSYNTQSKISNTSVPSTLIFSKVAAYLNSKDLINFCSTCKKYYSNTFWQEVLTEKKIFWAPITLKGIPLQLSLPARSKIAFSNAVIEKCGTDHSGGYISHNWIDGSKKIVELFAHNSSILIPIAQFKLSSAITIERFSKATSWEQLLNYLEKALKSTSLKEVSLRIKSAAQAKNLKLVEHVLTTGVHVVSENLSCNKTLIQLIKTKQISSKVTGDKLYLYSDKLLIGTIQKKQTCKISLELYFDKNNQETAVQFVYQYAQSLLRNLQPWEINYALSHSKL